MYTYDPRENAITFYYNSTGFEGCGVIKIEKGTIEKTKLLRIATLWEDKRHFQLRLFERNFINLATGENIGYHEKYCY